MRTKIWIPILFLVIIVGCRSTKETLKTKVDQVATTENKLKTSVDSITRTVDRSASVIRTVEVTTIAELSKPDTLGHQWPVKLTTTCRKINTAIQNDKKQEKHVKADSDYKSDTKQKTAVKQTDSSRESTTIPLGIWILIGALTIAGAGYIIVRYF